MKFILIGHDFNHEVQTISQIFYPNEKFEKIENIQNAQGLAHDEIVIESSILGETCRGIIYKNNGVICYSENKIDTYALKEKKIIVKLTLYDALRKFTGFKPSWGVLTGVRPSKLILEYFKKGYMKSEIIEELVNKFDVDSEKVLLAMEVSEISKKILGNNKANAFDLYIGIPFCPSKCLYCSFTSYSSDRYSKYMEKYMACLFKEMEFVKNYNEGRFLESIYIGGGTPTALDDKSFESLLFEVNQRFDVSGLLEFTVEAGRPDTLSKEKLEIMKKYNVSRISINPQTLNDITLEKIGRKHNSAMFLEKFLKARSMGYDNINVDLILGLPGETEKNVEYTFKEILKLEPENITIHTLSVKRGSILKENINKIYYDKLLENIEEVERMIEISRFYMDKMNMKPYYMYRQKNMVGNFENVGYCKEGFESVYNVQIMEEQQSILAIGANAVSKFYFPEENRIERVFNLKSLEEYIERIDEMVHRKELMLDKIN